MFYTQGVWKLLFENQILRTNANIIPKEYHQKNNRTAGAPLLLVLCWDPVGTLFVFCWPSVSILLVWGRWCVVVGGGSGMEWWGVAVGCGGGGGWS